MAVGKAKTSFDQYGVGTTNSGDMYGKYTYNFGRENYNSLDGREAADLLGYDHNGKDGGFNDYVIAHEEREDVISDPVTSIHDSLVALEESGQITAEQRVQIEMLVNNNYHPDQKKGSNVSRTMTLAYFLRDSANLTDTNGVAYCVSDEFFANNEVSSFYDAMTLFYTNDGDSNRKLYDDISYVDASQPEAKAQIEATTAYMEAYGDGTNLNFTPEQVSNLILGYALTDNHYADDPYFTSDTNYDPARGFLHDPTNGFGEYITVSDDGSVNVNYKDMLTRAVTMGYPNAADAQGSIIASVDFDNLTPEQESVILAYSMAAYDHGANGTSDISSTLLIESLTAEDPTMYLNIVILPSMGDELGLCMPLTEYAVDLAVYDDQVDDAELDKTKVAKTEANAETIKHQLGCFPKDVNTPENLNKDDARALMERLANAAVDENGNINYYIDTRAYSVSVDDLCTAMSDLGVECTDFESFQDAVAEEIMNQNEEVVTLMMNDPEGFNVGLEFIDNFDKNGTVMICGVEFGRDQLQDGIQTYLDDQGAGIDLDAEIMRIAESRGLDPNMPKEAQETLKRYAFAEIINGTAELSDGTMFSEHIEGLDVEVTNDYEEESDGSDDVEADEEADSYEEEDVVDGDEYEGEDQDQQQADSSVDYDIACTQAAFNVWIYHAESNASDFATHKEYFESLGLDPQDCQDAVNAIYKYVQENPGTTYKELEQQFLNDPENNCYVHTEGHDQVDADELTDDQEVDVDESTDDQEIDADEIAETDVTDDQNDATEASDEFDTMVIDINSYVDIDHDGVCSVEELEQLHAVLDAIENEGGAAALAERIENCYINGESLSDLTDDPVLSEYLDTVNSALEANGGIPENFSDVMENSYNAAVTAAETIDAYYEAQAEDEATV